MMLLAQITSNDTAFIGVASTIVGSMATAIVHLYFKVSATIQRELDECKKDRDDLRKIVMNMDGRLVSIEKGKS